MKYKVIPTPEFIKNLKALKKRYKSIKKDVLLLSEKLEENPKIGTCLGNNIYKVRVKIAIIIKVKVQDIGLLLIWLMKIWKFI